MMTKRPRRSVNPSIAFRRATTMKTPHRATPVVRFSHTMRLAVLCGAACWASGGASPLSAAAPVTALAFAPDGRSLVVGSQQGLSVVRWPQLDQPRKLSTQAADIHDLKFSPRGDVLAAAGGAAGEAGTLETYSWPEGKRLAHRAERDDVIYAVAWSPDGKLIASAGFDRTVVILEAATLKPARTLEGHSRGVMAVCFIGDGGTLVTAGIDQSLRVWNVSDGSLIRVLEHHTRPVHDLAPRPGQDAAAPPMVASVSDDRTLRLWQPTIGRLVRFKRLPSPPLAVRWTGDGQRAVVSCADGRVRVIDPDTVQVVADLPGINGWAYSLAIQPGNAREAVVGGAGGTLKRIQLPDQR